MPYQINLAISALEDLQCFRKSDRVGILDAIYEQLIHEPATKTRKRKALRENILARWVLRKGDFRVFYNVDEAKNVVSVTAVGHKIHNKLFIGGKEVGI